MIKLFSKNVPLLPLLAVLVMAAHGVAQDRSPRPDWPQWRGPDRNGISKETGLLKEWPKEGPKLLWTAKGCGIGFSSVAVKDGLIYTAGTLEPGTFVFAFDLDGNLKWKTQSGSGHWKMPAGKWDGDMCGSRSTPTVNDGLVYHLQELGRLAALDAKTGQEVWAVDLRKEFDGKPNMWGYSESVLIDGSNVICAPGGKKGYMAALDKKTGKTVWANTDIADESVSNASPILVEDHGVRQIITMFPIWVVGVEADTGKLLWHYTHANRYKENCETPLYQGGCVYVSSGYRKGSELLKLDYRKGELAVEKVWSNNKADDLHGGPILLDGFLYAAGYDHKGFFCLDFNTGEEKWRQPEIGRCSMTYADGMIYALEENGVLRLIAPSPKEFKLVSQFTLPKDGPGLYMAHPVVCGGRLYVRHGEWLYAYDIKGRL